MLKALMVNPRAVVAFVVLFVFIFVALLADFIAPFPIDEMDLSLRLSAPDSVHWLGCDLNGQDVLTAMFYGARVSLYIAAATVLLNLMIGMLIGLVSGYFGGIIDTLFMRLVDVFLAVPVILVAMVLSALLGSSTTNVIFAIAATGWASTSRLVRGQVLTLREREYVTACKALGGKSPRILLRHILPGTITPVIIHATFSLSGVIIVEASLSFLGLGAQDGPPTWGALLGQGRTVLTEAPHLSIAPGIAIMLVVLALNFLGDALRDSFDPRKS